MADGPADRTKRSSYTDAMQTKSPFPGLDPYLELHWGDVHHRLIQYSSDAIQPALPEDLLARVEERVYVESDAGRVRSIVPDAHVVEWHPATAGTAVMTVNEVAVAEPACTVLEDLAEFTEGYIEIRERDGGRVVTVIEFLSPANKAGGDGTVLYLKKQTQVLRSDSSLVEIDLVRVGRRVLAVRPFQIPERVRNDYLACIRRGWLPEQRDLYAFALRAPLPILGIPLRAHEPYVPLDLQMLVDQCYRHGRYDRLDYTAEPDPPLRPDDTAWADAVLKAANKRRSV